LTYTQAEFLDRSKTAENRHSGKGEIPDPEGHKSTRKLRYRLRAVAGRIMGRESRVGGCGRKPLHADIQIHRALEGGAFFAGVEKCGSVWLCPVCASQIAEGRKREVEQVLEAHQGAGGHIYMAAFTIRHSKFDNVSDLRSGVALAWRRMAQGAGWLAIKKRYGIVGTVRALEVTHSLQNGWHPHLHVLVATKRNIDHGDASDLSYELFTRWARIVEKLGLGKCDGQAFSFESCRNIGAAGDYVAKWGTAAEVAKGHSKIAGNGGRAPWQLLADAAEGDRTAVALFVQYARAFKGARQLTWAVGFRELYGYGPEAEDEDLLADPLSLEHVGSMPKGIYREATRLGLQADILSAAELGGWPAVVELVNKHGISFDGLGSELWRPPGRRDQNDFPQPVATAFDTDGVVID